MRENKSTFYSHYLSTACDLRLGTRRRTPWGPAESASAFVGSPLGATRSNSLFSSWTEGHQRFPKPLGIVSKPFAVISKGLELFQKLCPSRPKGLPCFLKVYPSFLKRYFSSV